MAATPKSISIPSPFPLRFTLAVCAVRSQVHSENIDIYPGNYGVQYGRVNGGIVILNYGVPARIHSRLCRSGHIRFGCFPRKTHQGTQVCNRGQTNYFDAILAAPTGDSISIKTAPFYYDGQALFDYKVPSITLNCWSTVQRQFIALIKDPPNKIPVPRADCGLRWNGLAHKQTGR